MGSELGVTGETVAKVRFDGLGLFYVLLASVWTVAVIGGMSFLFVNRNTQVMRVRGLALSLSSVSILHVYWVSVVLGYVLGPIEPLQIAYWLMGLWLPVGIALFTASNYRFLYIAKSQERFTKGEEYQLFEPALNGRRVGFMARFRMLSFESRTLSIVGVGMIFQFCLTLVMYLISRKFHPTYGIPGTEVTGTPQQRKYEMGRGWEWWPSIFWYMLWCCVIAPIILWKARHIKDTQGWRFQTIACCIAGFPACPMWLIALYSEGLNTVNQYFIPPMWIAVSIMVNEAFTIFVPCWEVRRHHTLRQETLEAIAQWEAKRVAGGSSTAVSMTYTNDSTKSGNSQENVLTMSALEQALKQDPKSLQQFSAVRDFSGENIAFLTSVDQWKTSWPSSASDTDKEPEFMSEVVLREQFNHALRIYCSFVSSKYAEFPVNLSFREYDKLEDIFEEPAHILHGDRVEFNTASLFNLPDGRGRGSDEIVLANRRGSDSDGVDKLKYVGDIPENFSHGVFDEAEKGIKYLVLTNTWPKYVRDGQASSKSSLSLGT